MKKKSKRGISDLPSKFITAWIVRSRHCSTLLAAHLRAIRESGCVLLRADRR